MMERNRKIKDILKNRVQKNRSKTFFKKDGKYYIVNQEYTEEEVQMDERNVVIEFTKGSNGKKENN